jgi:hypothetical protein
MNHRILPISTSALLIGQLFLAIGVQPAIQAPASTEPAAAQATQLVPS